MDETPSVVRGLRSDFNERNTALFCFLGILSITSRLTRTLEEEARLHNAAQRRTNALNDLTLLTAKTSATSLFDCFMLGLISFSRTVATAATAAATSERVRSEDKSEPPPTDLRDLLR